MEPKTAVQTTIEPKILRSRARKALKAGCLVGSFLIATTGLAIGWQLVSPRPPDTTEPRIFADDGAELDYCQLPVLDGAGLEASDIPKAFTPDCGWEQWPMPVLADCTEPLADGVVDLRGLWRGRNGDVDHVERIEQCGNRIVVTAAGIIHDIVADDTLANGAHDIRGGGSCQKIRAAVSWRDGVLSFRPFGLPNVLVKRELHGDQLLWTYPGIGELSMRRICQVPTDQR